MPDKNVLRRDVVQIGFEVENNPFSELNKEMERMNQSTEKVIEFAEKATSELEATTRA